MKNKPKKKKKEKLDMYSNFILDSRRGLKQFQILSSKNQMKDVHTASLKPVAC